MSAGGSILAMTRSRPPHCRQVSMSMANTFSMLCVMSPARSSARPTRAADPRGDPLHQLLERIRARGRDRDEHETPSSSRR
jgi:hypothetical protein